MIDVCDQMGAYIVHLAGEISDTQRHELTIKSFMRCAFMPVSKHDVIRILEVPFKAFGLSFLSLHIRLRTLRGVTLYD